MADANAIRICSSRMVDCSNNLCSEPNHICVDYPQCNARPACYPMPSFNEYLCLLMTSKKTDC